MPVRFHDSVVNNACCPAIGEFDIAAFLQPSGRSAMMGRSVLEVLNEYIRKWDLTTRRPRHLQKTHRWWNRRVVKSARQSKK